MAELENYLTNIANAIREKKKTNAPINAQDFASEILNLPSGGGSGDNYYDTFWDNYQQNGERANYAYAFYGVGWNDRTFKPKYKFIAKTRDSFSDMFRGNLGITEINSVDHFETPTNKAYANYMFYGTNIKKVIFDLNGFSTCGHMFRASEVEWVELYNLSGDIFDRTFENCSKLHHLYLEGTPANKTFTLASSPLDKDSIINVVNFLSDTTNGQAVTFNLSAVNSAFETANGLADGSTSEEWLALIATKSNWTISLA